MFFPAIRRCISRARGTPQSIADIRKTLGLDKPLPEQFVRYVEDARAWRFRQFARHRSAGRHRNRIAAAGLRRVTLFGLIISMAIAIPLGILAAVKQGSWIDHTCRIVATAGVSLPVFFSGLLLVYVFYFRLGWAPAPLGRLNVFYDAPPHVTGFYLIDSLIAGDFHLFRAALSQLLLPGLTLAIFSLAPITRMTRAAMLEVLASDYVRTARASGLSPYTVTVTYAFRNAMLPVITTLGMVFSFLLGANVLVEKVFAWPGIGSFAVEALLGVGLRPGAGFRSHHGGDVRRAQSFDRHPLWRRRSAREAGSMTDIVAVPPAQAGSLTLLVRHARYVIGENPVTGLAFGLFVVILVAAILGPWIVPYNPLASDTAAALKPPTLGHLFGTDQLGRDIFSRVVAATRLDFTIAITSVALVFLMGGIAGVAAGYFGGWTDRIVSRIADTIMAFPLFVLAMGIVAALGNSVQNIVLATAIINFPLYARVARAEANVRREAGFVEAARLSGNSEWRILSFHILPNVFPILVVQMSLTMGYAILNAAGLSFIGLGVRPPAPEWGIMVADGAANIISGEWWIAFFPGAALMIAVFCFNLLGDGLRDIVDPRRRT